MVKKVLSQNEVRAAVDKMAQRILRDLPPSGGGCALIGIHSRGVPLARRLAASLKEKGLADVPVGALDITFYRDDMGEAPLHPILQDTDIPFDLTGFTIFLVDDVLYTGRTIRCALDELMDFGRPSKVRLAVLVDRGQRELPIQPDVVGETMLTPADQRVEVHLEEVDGEDAVWIAPAKARAPASS